MTLTVESKLALNDGQFIPQLGLGVWQTRAGAMCEAAVLAALEAGYRHIDTARQNCGIPIMETPSERSTRVCASSSSTMSIFI